MVDITVAEALAYSVLGFAIVFLGLILLMAVIHIMAAIMGTNKKKQAAAEPAPAAAPAAPKAVAPGSAGEIKLYDVPDKEAAMIMAIVANKMQKPLNELRFKSIKEVK